MSGLAQTLYPTYGLTKSANQKFLPKINNHPHNHAVAQLRTKCRHCFPAGSFQQMQINK
jgi:hypothetical protein